MPQQWVYLPEEIRVYILTFLNVSNVLQMALVSKACHVLCVESQEIWKALTTKLWKTGPPHPLPRGLEWRQYYMERYFLGHKDSMTWRISPKKINRYRHSATACGDIIVLIGGSNIDASVLGDVIYLDTKTDKCHFKKIHNKPPNFKLTRHTATYIKKMGIYIFGGSTQISAENISIKTNALHILDVDSQNWVSDVNTTGQAPCARSDHAAASIGSKIYIFGGSDSNVSPLNDLHVFDTATNAWIQLEQKGNVPYPRSGHSMAAVGNSLYLFGGAVWNKTEWIKKSNDIYIYSIDTNIWSLLVASGPPPPVATFCAVFTIYHQLFVVFGGYKDLETVSDEAYVFDTVQLLWKKLERLGAIPSARDCVSATVVGHKAYMIAGHHSDELCVLHLNWAEKLARHAFCN